MKMRVRRKRIARRLSPRGRVIKELLSTLDVLNSAMAVIRLVVKGFSYKSETVAVGEHGKLLRRFWDDFYDVNFKLHQSRGGTDAPVNRGVQFLAKQQRSNPLCWGRFFITKK